MSLEVDSPPAPPELPPTREQTRSRRKREVRAKTVSVKRMTKRELEIGRVLYPAYEHEGVKRPATRADCADAARPCPFVSCKYNLYLDVSDKTGAIKLNFPDLEVDELRVSCALDVADQGGATLEVVAEMTNLTRERILQVEVKGLARMAKHRDLATLGEDFDVLGGDEGKRRLPMLGSAKNPA